MRVIVCGGRKYDDDVRVREVLAYFRPDAVIAFPGGRGTADMVAKAKLAGVRVIEVSP